MTSALNIASDQEFIETRADGVVTLTLNRPERLNALATSIMEGLLEALPRLEKDPDVGVIILTGAGRAFCSGGDVKSMAEGSASQNFEDAVQRLRGRMEVARLLHEIEKPTIAMVNGVAAGAGLSLALACDLRIAARSARFGLARELRHHRTDCAGRAVREDALPRLKVAVLGTVPATR